MPGQNVILIGMPGSGKTTLGKHMAERTGMPFIDTDTLIEQTVGKPVTDIFGDMGEEGFRSVEREIIKKAAGMKNTIIATGGGAWVDACSREYLARGGEVTYLACDLRELWRRLQNSPVVRPLLKEGFSALEKLYNKRHRQYMSAHHIIDTSKSSVEEAVAGLVEINELNEMRWNADEPLYNQRVSLQDRGYDIVIGSRVMDSVGKLLEERYMDGCGSRPKLLLVTNPFVNALYGRKLKYHLQQTGFNVSRFIVPEGEDYKSLEWAGRIYSHLASKAFGREDVVLALGGGVTGDLAGFAAATYMRGMAFVQLPTTLLAQVDSSVGGKTAVNLSEGKNLVGAFHQPDLVVAELGLLKHLSEYHFRQGLAECAKYGILDSSGFFDMLEENLPAIMNREPEVLGSMVRRCCGIKAGIVEKDEREKGLRMVLNLGHTVGHALEAEAGYGSLGHGDAVALGIRVKSYIGCKMNLLNQQDYRRILKLLDGFGLLSEGVFSLVKVMEYIGKDKKRKKGEIRFVMPKGIGAVEISADIPAALVEEGLKLVGCK